MPKVLRYSQTWFDCDGGGNSYPKFEAGQSYPLHDDAERHVAAGIAEVIEVRAGAKDGSGNPEKAQSKTSAAAVATEPIVSTQEKS